MINGRVSQLDESEFKICLFGKPVYTRATIALAVTISAAMFICAVILSPILIPLHFILRRQGRNGFYFCRRIVIGPESFYKE